MVKYGWGSTPKEAFDKARIASKFRILTTVKAFCDRCYDVQRLACYDRECVVYQLDELAMEFEAKHHDCE